MGADGFDERVFASLEKVLERGGDAWWLYASRCKACGQPWMVAQDERIYDNFYLRRLDPAAAQLVFETSKWPLEFSTYERVLRLGRTLSQPWVWLDPRNQSLVWTAEDLRRERPDISIAEIAYLLGIPEHDARELL